MNDLEQARASLGAEFSRRTREDRDFRAAVNVPHGKEHTVVPLAPGDSTDWLLDRVDEAGRPVVAVAERDGELAAYVVFRVVAT